MEVLGGVLVFRRVAATDMAALQAQAQVHPTVTHFQALFASPGVRSDWFNVIQMFAGLHNSLPKRMTRPNRSLNAWTPGHPAHSMILIFGKLLLGGSGKHAKDQRNPPNSITLPFPRMSVVHIP
jgi:hypothetical protein